MTESADVHEQRCATGRRAALVMQCFAVPVEYTVSHGTMFVYLDSLGVEREQILVYLSLPFLGYFMFGLVGAFCADIYGKKRVGYIGMTLELLGFIVVLASTFLSPEHVVPAVVVGLSVYSAGWCASYGGWFALMDPLVPQTIRSRFWARLRLTWQLVTICVLAACAWLLSEGATTNDYRLVFSVIVVALIARMVVYTRLPELEDTRTSRNFFRAVVDVIRIDRFLSYCAYLFLLYLLVGGCLTVFNLIERKILGFAESQVVGMGNIGMLGAVLGFIVGGRLVERMGTKFVFLTGHFSYAAVMVAFMFRGVSPLSPLVHAALLHLAYEAIRAVLSIAIITELLSLVPTENKSLSTSFCYTLATGGAALAGVIFAGLLKLGVLNKSWDWLGLTFSDYDTVLLVCSGLLVVLVISLGLVPSVIAKAEPDCYNR